MAAQDDLNNAAVAYAKSLGYVLPLPPPPPPTTGRWYASTAYPNRVVPANPTLDPNSGSWQAMLGSLAEVYVNGLSGIGGAWSSTVYHASASTPKITVALAVSFRGATSVTFPCAAGWVPTPDSDAHMIVISDVDGTYWEFQGLNLTTKHAHGVASSNIITGDAVSAASERISILPTPMGLIRPDEIVAGTIPHALRCTLSLCSTAFRWPAVASDGNKSGGIPSGAHIWLPRSATLGTLDQNQAMIAKALQEYGAYVGDSTGSNNFTIFAQSTADGKTTFPFMNLTLPQAICKQLVVLFA
jgi:hypothetical protein